MRDLKMMGRAILAAGLALAASAHVVHAEPAARAAQPFAPFGLQCSPTEANLSLENANVITAALEQRYVSAFGKDWEKNIKPAKRIDPKEMEGIAEISACAAMLDQMSCSVFYDYDFGGRVADITHLGKKTPLRQQFDAAIAALQHGEAKRAAQSCLKRVGGK